MSDDLEESDDRSAEKAGVLVRPSQPERVRDCAPVVTADPDDLKRNNMAENDVRMIKLVWKSFDDPKSLPSTPQSD